MTDKYQKLRNDLAAAIADAERQGGVNERAEQIAALLAERDALAAAPVSAEPDDQMCRQAYGDFYHKIRAEIGYDHWCAIWRFIAKRLSAPVSAEPINWPAVEGRISDFVGEYEMVGEDGQGREGYYIPNEHERALIVDAIHGLLADSEVMALLRPAAPFAAQAQPYSLNLDPAGIRALTADAITGALALGAQGAEQPPADHWLKAFYEMGRQSAAEEMTVVPAVAQKFAERLSAALKSLDQRHFNGVNVQLAIRDVVHSFTRIDASDVAAMAQPERHAENTETVVCGCGDHYPTGSYGAGFIAAAGHCENCDAAKGKVADKVDADPLQGAADWLVKDCGVKYIAALARHLSIGYNRATRLMEAARKEPDR